MLNLIRLLSVFTVVTVMAACSTSEEVAVEVAEETVLAGEMVSPEGDAPETVSEEEAPAEEASEVPAESEEAISEEEAPAPEDAVETPEAG